MSGGKPAKDKMKKTKRNTKRLFCSQRFARSKRSFTRVFVVQSQSEPNSIINPAEFNI